MESNRYKTVGGHLIEEFYWAGKMIVYVDNRKSDLSFESACKHYENGDQS